MRLDVTSAKMRKRLVAELSAQPPALAPQHPETAQPSAGHASQQRVKWAQAALSVVLGLRLPLDGVLGGTTQAAVRRFQAQAGMAQTGALDSPTVAALAKAIGHAPPGQTPEHPLMPRWFRQERQVPRPQPEAKAARKSQGPGDVLPEPNTPTEVRDHPFPIRGVAPSEDAREPSPKRNRSERRSLASDVGQDG